MCLRSAEANTPAIGWAEPVRVKAESIAARPPQGEMPPARRSAFEVTGVSWGIGDGAVIGVGVAVGASVDVAVGAGGDGSSVDVAVGAGSVVEVGVDFAVGAGNGVEVSVDFAVGEG